MNTTALILIVFLTCCVISVFYWHVVWKIAIRTMRFRLFARRDKLRRMALDKKEDRSSFAYGELEEFICKTIAVVPSISLASLITSILRNPNPRSESLDRFRDEASPELAELLSKTSKDALYIMALNSPILLSMGAIIVFSLWIVGRVNKMLLFVYRQAEHVIDELPAERTRSVPQPA
jgi:hypothetical protein